MATVAPSNTDLSVGIYTSRPDAFLVNSYLVDTADGLVVIDTQFLLSEAEGLNAAITATGKPLAAIFITHPHPDHFNGTGVLLANAPNTPVYATQATLDGIRAIEASKRAYWTPIHGTDYPQTTALPNQILASGQSVTIGSVTFTVEDVGAGETSNMTLIYLPQQAILFAGDTAYHRVHPWLVESHSQAWLEQLAYIQTHYASAQTVYVGHGLPGTLALFAEQTDYIEAFRTLVNQNRVALTAGDTPEVREQIIAQTKQQHPDWPLDMLIGLNIDGILAEHQTTT